MRVTLRGIGHMRDYLGDGPHTVFLPEGATLSDLLIRIEQDFKDQLTGSIWNWREHRFRGPVVIVLGQRIVKDRTTPLQDQQEVSFHKALVGG